VEHGVASWGVLVAALVFFLWLDLHFFARGREPRFKEAAWWSVGWLVLSLLAAIPVLILEGSEDAVTYTTVYLIERSLSLDNLFVFLLLFAYFGVPYQHRPRLLFFGIVAALALRGAFILLFIAPLIYGLYYPQPYLSQILRKVPIAVVDNDLSELSRAIVQTLDASGAVSVALQAGTLAEARAALAVAVAADRSRAKRRPVAIEEVASAQPLTR